MTREVCCCGSFFGSSFLRPPPLPLPPPLTPENLPSLPSPLSLPSPPPEGTHTHTRWWLVHAECMLPEKCSLRFTKEIVVATASRSLLRQPHYRGNDCARAGVCPDWKTRSDQTWLHMRAARWLAEVTLSSWIKLTVTRCPVVSGLCCSWDTCCLGFRENEKQWCQKLLVTSSCFGKRRFVAEVSARWPVLLVVLCGVLGRDTSLRIVERQQTWTLQMGSRQ